MRFPAAFSRQLLFLLFEPLLTSKTVVASTLGRAKRDPCEIALILMVLGPLTLFLSGSATDTYNQERFESYLDGSISVQDLLHMETPALHSPNPASRVGTAVRLRDWLTRLGEGLESGEVESVRTPYMNQPWINRGWDFVSTLPEYLGGRNDLASFPWPAGPTACSAM